MMHIAQFEEIVDLMLQLPALLRKQERSAVEFPSAVGAWLESVERSLSNGRQPLAGSIAALRSGVIGAARGQADAGPTPRGRPSRSRLVSAAAGQALRRSAEILTALVNENQPRLAEAELVARQIVAAAISRGVVEDRGAEVGGIQSLRALRRSLAASQDLESAAVHLEGLIGPHDALVALDRALAGYRGSP